MVLVTTHYQLRQDNLSIRARQLQRHHIAEEPAVETVHRLLFLSSEGGVLLSHFRNQVGVRPTLGPPIVSRPTRPRTRAVAIIHPHLKRGQPKVAAVWPPIRHHLGDNRTRRDRHLEPWVGLVSSTLAEVVIGGCGTSNSVGGDRVRWRGWRGGGHPRVGGEPVNAKESLEGYC